MNDQQTWVEALNIKPESLAEWSSQAPDGKPLLVYCLEQGHIDFEQYSAWAMEAFGLPSLHSNFFQQSFDPSFLEQARLTGSWHPWCFPVEQWEDVVYVACVEPPKEEENNGVRYVLADPRMLREAWGSTSTGIRTENPPPLPLTNEEMPTGMSAEAKPFTLNLDEATFNIGPVTEVKTSAEIAPEPPPPQAPPVPEGTNLSIVLNLPSQDDEGKEARSEAPPAPPAAAKAAPELKVVANKDPKEKKAAPAAAASAPAPAKAKTKVKTTNAAPTADDEQAVETMFAAFRERYTAALIMKCSEQIVRLYKWDDSISPTADVEKTSVNLSYPTFMRIVSKTNMPYHGYLVDSPAHREFFAALSLAELPVCVTAIPIRFDNRLWGMVIAFGTEENQKMDSLSFAQDATEKMLNVVAGSWSKAS